MSSEVRDKVMEFNATFNNISVISWHSVLLMGKPEYLEKANDLLQVIDKLDHINVVSSTHHFEWDSNSQV